MYPKHYLGSFIQLICIKTVFSECQRYREFDDNVLKTAVCDEPVRYDSIADWVISGIYPDKLTTVKFNPTFGGVLAVKSISSLNPTGISVVSNNAFEGLVKLAGELPFVGTSSIEGLMPSIGNGAINHVCGNGFNALTSITVSSPVIHTISEHANPCTTPFELVLMDPVTSLSAPVLAISNKKNYLAVPYTIATLVPIAPVPNCHTLSDPRISVLSQSVLPSSSYVSSVETGQSNVGTPDVSSYKEGFVTVPCNTEVTAAHRENLLVTDASDLQPKDMKLDQ